MSDAHTRCAWRAFVSDPTAENALRWAVLEARGREALPQPAEALNKTVDELRDVWDGVAFGATGRIMRSVAWLWRRTLTTGRGELPAELKLPNVEPWPDEVTQEAHLPSLIRVRHVVAAGPYRLRFAPETGDLTLLAIASGLDRIGIVDADWTQHLVAVHASKAHLEQVTRARRAKHEAP